jgi:hypothetical protein
MPLFVYRHFTGAVCTTSSDGRFALFSAPCTAAFSVASRLSNSSDILLRASSEPPRRGSPVARTRFKTLIYLKGFDAGAYGAIGPNDQIFGAPPHLFSFETLGHDSSTTTERFCVANIPSSLAIRGTRFTGRICALIHRAKVIFAKAVFQMTEATISPAAARPVLNSSRSVSSADC